MLLNQVINNFQASTSKGDIDFYEWAGKDWVLFFSHPKDFTPVCTTEIARVAELEPEFTKRGIKVLGLSLDSQESHKEWMLDVEELAKTPVNFPIIADPTLTIAKALDLLPAGSEANGNRTAADNATARTIMLIDAHHKVRFLVTYPMSTGRNMAEVLRVIDSIQLTETFQVATPVDWKHGEDVIILPSISNEDAKGLFPKGWKTVKSYLRKVAHPQNKE